MKPTSPLIDDKQPWINEQFGVLYIMIGHVWLLAWAAIHYLDINDSLIWILLSAAALSLALVANTWLRTREYNTVSFNDKAIGILIITAILSLICSKLDVINGIFFLIFMVPLALTMAYIYLVVKAHQKRNYFVTTFHTIGLIKYISFMVYCLINFNEVNLPFMGLVCFWGLLWIVLGLLLIIIARNMKPHCPEEVPPSETLPNTDPR